MTPENIKLLIREGEGLSVEFKEKYSSRSDEDIIAFANTKGGTLLLGVRDNGTIAGEKLTNDLKAKINSLARNCKPGITADIAQVGEVVVIEVPEGSDKPYSCGSGYYRRLNATTQKMTNDELRVMFRENELFPFEEKTVRGFSFDDISKAKIRAFTKEAGISIGMGIRKMRDVMANAGLKEPAFDTGGFFRAIFYRPETAFKEEITKKLGEKLGENEKKTLDLIRQNEHITIAEIAPSIGISTTAVENNLSKLKKKGLIRRIGPAKGGHWEIMK